MTPEEERQLGVDLFNRAWTLMEADERTPEQDYELINTAHASAYHWAQVGTAANRARSEWQLSRVYTVVGRAEPALHHAARCQAIVAYVTLKGGDEGSVEMLEELRSHVADKIGPIAKPANIVFTPELPKTRSGKIMRRLLRDVAEHR